MDTNPLAADAADASAAIRVSQCYWIGCTQTATEGAICAEHQAEVERAVADQRRRDAAAAALQAEIDQEPERELEEYELCPACQVLFLAACDEMVLGDPGVAWTAEYRCGQHQPDAPVMVTVCAGPECDRPAVVNGLCKSHDQQRASGKELTPLRAYVKRAA